MLAVFGAHEAHCFYGREGAHRKGRTGVWPESVLYDQLGSGGFIDRKKHKTGQTFFLTLDHPTLPFGFKIVKYAGLNSDQLDLILGKNLARLLRIEPKPAAPKTMDITQI
jgi:hypothetical protein